MFGRKRKRDEENLGLSAPYVSPSSTDLSISVSPSATPGMAPTPSQTPQPVQTPFTFPMGAGAMPTNMTEMLGQILGGNGPITELISEIKKDPEGFRNRIMQQAQAAGVSTFVMTPQGMMRAGAAAQPQHLDVVDELTKAAALHDKGALTDAEFEALKQKLLGQ
jgi:Short C-terminal domain